LKACNSEYVYDLIKGCRYGNGFNEEKKLKCSCMSNCAMCSVGGKVIETLTIKGGGRTAKWADNATTGTKARRVKKDVPKMPREVNSRRVPIWMHPELHDAYIESQARKIRSNTSKGRVKKIKEGEIK
jgi:hypothetical protein